MNAEQLEEGNPQGFYGSRTRLVECLPFKENVSGSSPDAFIIQFFFKCSFYYSIFISPFFLLT
jgi:hypothetical protein